MVTGITRTVNVRKVKTFSDTASTLPGCNREVVIF